MMPAKLTPLIDKIDAQPLRERILVFFVIIIVSALAWWNLFVTPSFKEHNTLLTKEKTMEQHLKLLEIQLGGFTPLAIEHKITRVAAEHANKEAELKKIENSMKNMGAQVVSTNKINQEVLQNLLENAKTLHLLNMEKIDNTLMDNKLLNKLGVVLTLKGQYFPFLAFLENLEQLHWQLFWDSLEYDVTNYPEAQITLHLAIPNVGSKDGDL